MGGVGRGRGRANPRGPCEAAGREIRSIAIALAMGVSNQHPTNMGMQIKPAGAAKKVVGQKGNDTHPG